MWPFYLLIFIPLLIQHIKIEGVDYYKKNKFALILFFVMLLFLLMFRNKSVGNDTANYFYIFKEIGWHELPEYSGFFNEYGFTLFTKLIYEITSNPQMFIVITSFVVIVLMLPSYLRLCEDSTLTILLFCSLSTFVMMFSGIRQMLAISIGFIVYYYVRKKKPLISVSISLIATSIHTSAVILLLMYPLYHAKITRKWLWIVIPCTLIVFVFNVQIFTFLGMFIDEYTRFDSTIEETGAYTMIVLFVVLGVYAFMIPNEEKLDEELMGLRNFLIFAIIIQLFAPLHTLAMRMGYYYIIFIPLLIPKVIKHRSLKWNQVAIYSRHLMIIAFILYFFFIMYTSQPLDVVPYSFCWEVTN